MAPSSRWAYGACALRGIQANSAKHLGRVSLISAVAGCALSLCCSRHNFRQCATTASYFAFATMDSRASAFCTIVPLRRTGSGRLSLQRDPGAYAAVKSHKNPLRSQQSGMKLAGRLRFLDDRRDKMAGVPELSYPAIIEAIQHTRTRRTPVGRKNRLPHREHHHRAFGVILQNRLDCGRPPQTSRSSRREQQNHAQLVRCPVEFRLQRGKRCAVHFHERRLPRWRVSRSREVDPAENHHQGRRKHN